MPAWLGRTTVSRGRLIAISIVAAVLVVDANAQQADRRDSTASARSKTGQDPSVQSAMTYSMHNTAVAVAVHDAFPGTANKLDGQTVVSFTRDVLESKRGLPTKHFLDTASRHSSMTFFVQGKMLGPYALDQVLPVTVLAARIYSESFRPKYLEADDLSKDGNVAGIYVELTSETSDKGPYIGDKIVEGLRLRGVPAKYLTESIGTPRTFVVVFLKGALYANPVTKTSAFGLASILLQLDEIAKQYHSSRY